MARCSQCTKPAMFEVDGHPICLDCKAKLSQMWQAELAGNVSQLNFLLGMAEAQTGLPGTLPRYQVPQPTIQQGPVNFNNINVSESVVGAINMGQVRQIDVAMDRIATEGNTELVASLKAFTETVLADQQLKEEHRDEIIEMLAFLTTQCALPKGGRQPSIAQTVLERVGQMVQTVTSLSPLWAPLLAALQTMF